MQEPGLYIDGVKQDEKKRMQQAGVGLNDSGQTAGGVQVTPQQTPAVATPLGTNTNAGFKTTVLSTQDNFAADNPNYRGATGGFKSSPVPQSYAAEPLSNRQFDPLSAPSVFASQLKKGVARPF
jgi:hypothetical protein